jgi:hypothetical protein
VYVEYLPSNPVEYMEHMHGELPTVDSRIGVGTTMEDS